MTKADKKGRQPDTLNKGKDHAQKVLEDDTNKMKTLDEIFAPFREHTEKISEEEIDDLVKKARKDLSVKP